MEWTTGQHNIADTWRVEAASLLQAVGAALGSYLGTRDLRDAPKAVARVVDELHARVTANPYDLRANEVADELILAMEDDHGGPFPHTLAARHALVKGVRRMVVAGCPFTDEQIDDFVAAEETERRAKFSGFDGFAETAAALTVIFDGGE